MSQEKLYLPTGGYLALTGNLLLLTLSLISFSVEFFESFAFWGLLLSFAMLKGYFNVKPGEAKSVLLLGEYLGTVKKSGFYWVNPLASKEGHSLKIKECTFRELDVLDKNAFPLQVDAFCRWRLVDAYKAAYEIDNPVFFVKTQTAATINRLMQSFDVQAFYKSQDKKELSSELKALSESLEEEIKEKCLGAGIEVVEANVVSFSLKGDSLKQILEYAKLNQKLLYKRALGLSAVDLTEEVLKRAVKSGKLPLDEKHTQDLAADLILRFSEMD